MPTRSGSARYEGLGKAGKGWISTQSGVLSDRRYGFGTRFEDEPGTNPEELIAAAHASCFTMALSFALAAAGHHDGSLETSAQVTVEKDGDGFTITRSALDLRAKVPGISAEDFEKIALDAKKNCDGRYYQQRRLGRNDRIYRGYNGRYYCRRSDGTTGLIIGGISGGVLGSLLANGGSNTLGALIGAGAGALLGNSIDRGQVVCR